MSDDRKERARVFNEGKILTIGTPEARRVALEVLAQLSDIPSVWEDEIGKVRGGIHFSFGRNACSITIDFGGVVSIRLFHEAHRNEHLGPLVTRALDGGGK